MNAPELPRHEGGLALTMRIGRTMDHRGDPREEALVRLVAAVGKHWICKHVPNQAYEATECFGGSGGIGRVGAGQ